jgi:hypothetical protein
MSEPPKNLTGSNVKDFLVSFLGGLEEGLTEKGFKTCQEPESHMKMELNAIAVDGTSGEGGAKIMGLGGSVQTNNSNTNSHKITVFVRKRT